MDKEEEKLLKKILPNRYESADAYNIRLNGSGVLRNVNEYINIDKLLKATAIYADAIYRLIK